MPLRTVSNTGGNWNATTTWVGGVVPIAGDTVDFTATSGNLTVNVSTASLAGINFTNYVNTITFTNTINVNTAVNLGTGGYTQSGASGLTINGNTTITSNSVVWSRTLSFSTGTQTLADNLTVTGIVTFSGAVTVNSNIFNIGGNLTINGTTTGTSTIIFNGTGAQSWTHGSAVYLSNNLTINKSSGTLTLGSTVYFATGILTYTQGNIDFTTNNNTFVVVAGTYVTTGLTFNTFFFASGGSNSITLGSDLYTNTFTVGGAGIINGSFDIYCATLNVNNSTSGGGGAVTYARNFYCSGNCSVSSLKLTATAYIGGNCSYAFAASAIGFANLYMIGNGTLTALSTGNYSFPSNLYINTSGKIKLVGNFNFGNDTNSSAIINIIRGTIDATKATIILPTFQTHTLTNMNKMLGGNIVINTISPPVALIMNEFFCGDATNQANIATTNPTNATVTFTDNFEKIAKFVNINGITFTRPQQLLLITNQPKKIRNIGIRYGNSSPNGIPKGDPSVQNLQTVGQSRTLLLGDPSFVKSI